MIWKNTNIRAWLGAVVVFMATQLFAAPFEKTFPFVQPDGTVISIWGKGDEFHADFEVNGYSVIFDATRKAYVYASVSADGTQLLPTDLEVGKGQPAAIGLTPHLRMSADAVRQQALARFEQWDRATQVTRRWEEKKSGLSVYTRSAAFGPILMSPPSAPTTGPKKGLCLLIDFPDDEATIPPSEIDAFCNGNNYTGYGNNGSVRQFFLDNSNNQLDYSNVVTLYIRMQKLKSDYNDTSQDCGSQGRELIGDAIAIMKALPNYESEILPTFQDLSVDESGQVLAFNVFYAGGNGGVWAKGLWPHSSAMFAQSLGAGIAVSRYQLTNIGDSLELGTFCHENGHMLCGFPDIYDYGYDSTGGAGRFCMMNSGGHGSNPVQFCAYLKRAAGWATTIELERGDNELLTCVSELGQTGFNTFYRYAKPGNEKEYYLVENRNKSGRDAGLPASGIAIWHIDEQGNKDDQRMAYNTAHQNYECTLVQADGLWHFQKNSNSGDAQDLWYSGNTAVKYTGMFSDATDPSAKWWDGSVSGLDLRTFSEIGTSMTLNIVAIPPQITVFDPLPEGRVGVWYDLPFSVLGDWGPFTWSLVSPSSSLPTGFSFVDGVLSGMTEEEASFTFDVAVQGRNGIATTNTFNLTILPPFTNLFETFEQDSVTRDDWYNEMDTNQIRWAFCQGSRSGRPSAAGGGLVNAYLGQWDESAAVTLPEHVTKFIPPMIRLGDAAHAARLTFKLYMENRSAWVDNGAGGNVYRTWRDELKIYYKTNWAAAWSGPVKAFTNESSIAWHQQTVDLPVPASGIAQYYVAFEGSALGGEGISIDDVQLYDPTPSLVIATGATLTSALVDQNYTNVLTATGGFPGYTFTLLSGSLPNGFIFQSPEGCITGKSSTVQSASNFLVRVTDTMGHTVDRLFNLAVERPKVDVLREDFESYAMPAGWTQESVPSFPASPLWRTCIGGGWNDRDGLPVAPASGYRHAFLWTAGTEQYSAMRLISPVIDLSQTSGDTKLIFQHYMAPEIGRQDQLNVYYRVSPTSAWVLLAAYTDQVDPWTERRISLPNRTATYQIAFEGLVCGGYGVSIDLVRIAEDSSAPIISTAAVLPVGWKDVSYSTQLLAKGGSLPYQWNIVSGTLQTGLFLDLSSGLIYGTPTSAGTKNFWVEVRGDDGKTSTNAFSLTINQTIRRFSEAFEADFASTGWTKEILNGLQNAPIDWFKCAGVPYEFGGLPSSDHSGTGLNACFATDITQEGVAIKARLISPPLDLLSLGASNMVLRFWYCNPPRDGFGENDRLFVYSRPASTQTWTQLAAYTSPTSLWTEVLLPLTNPSATYQIAFEGMSRQGGGVVVDDVEISGNYGGTPLELWKDQYFPSGTNSGDTDDPDGDGIVNLLEYAMGLNPTNANVGTYIIGGVTNLAGSLLVPDGQYLYMGYRRDVNVTDLLFEVDATPALVGPSLNWQTNNVFELAPWVVGETGVWSWVYSVHATSVTNAPQRFMRLKVTPVVP